MSLTKICSLHYSSHLMFYVFMGLDKCIMICPPYSIQSIFTTLKILCAPPIHPTPHTQPLTTTDLFIISTVLAFPECHILGLICSLFRLAFCT